MASGKNVVKIASGAGFWGDNLSPAVEIAKRGNVDYLSFDFLAELTLSIFQRRRAKNPAEGYIPDLIPWSKALLPHCARNGVKTVWNGGCANPEAGANEVIKVAKELGLIGWKVGVVVGDDVLDRLDSIRAKGWKFKNLDTGEEDIDQIKDRIVAANAYIGADSIITALNEGAQIVITGRVSDNALYVGPLMHEFGWKYENGFWDKIGAAVTIGHILECGAASTSGWSTSWRECPMPWNIGNPIAEVEENGQCVITKLPDTGGMVTINSIKEHLVYEVHDPRNYLMPDGIADFTTLKLEQIGKDRVRVTKMSGKPRPDTLKVQIGYSDGFIGENTMAFPSPDALEKGKRAEYVVRERIKYLGLKPEKIRFDYLGWNTLFDYAPEPKEMPETLIRVAVKDRSREVVSAVRQAVTVAGMTVAGGSMPNPPPIRPVVALWPTLIPREEVPTRTIMKEVK